MNHSAAAQLRLMSDLRAIKQEPPEASGEIFLPRLIAGSYNASPVSDDNLYVWNATIFGPEETPWEGGIFPLKVQFSERYPEKPPRVRFTCDMFHPNIYSDGNICMDTIQDKWSPCHNICTVLMSIQSLLTDPNCASPANPEAAQLYTKDRTAYNRRVRRIAQQSIEIC
eukprot:gene10947-11101_t